MVSRYSSAAAMKKGTMSRIALTMMCVGVLAIFLHLEKPHRLGAIHATVLDGDYDELVELIKRGTDINAPVERSYDLYNTIFHCLDPMLGQFAPYYNWRNAKINNRNRPVPGTTSLLLAAQQGHREIVELLLDSGADVGVTNDNNVGVVYAATCSGSAHTLDLVLEAGADPTVISLGGLSSLHIAAYTADPSLCKALIAAEIDPNVCDNFGSTPLIWAAGAGRVRNVVLLIDAGGKIDLPNSAGCTAFMAAASQGHLECMRTLLDAGANLYLRDRAGRTALGYVKDLSMREAMRELLGESAY